MHPRLLPAFILIALGLFFQAANLGLLGPGSLRAALATWWPLILLFTGIGLLGRGRRQARRHIAKKEENLQD